MRLGYGAVSALIVLTGCASSSYGGMRAPDVVAARSSAAAGPRSAGHIPPGHYPPPGECRIWHEGRPPGQQPRPVRCDRLGAVPAGAFVLYNAKAWDTRYDWSRHARQNPGSVPDVVLRVMATVRGR